MYINYTRSLGEGHWERKCENKIVFFCSYFFKRGSTYVKPRPKSAAKQVVEYVSRAKMRRLYVCLSVCYMHHTPFVHSILERVRKFIFFRAVTSHAS